ncbi:MAG: hypothetical protein K6F48_04355 [Paludibacteraceae bacterium]|nr:hypothetical protein [Paludibacteraceae bacterium]
MKVKYNFLASVASLAVCAVGLFSSCEDKCVGCQCDAFVVDHVVNADSMDVPLTQLDAKTTVVIVGSGLSTANGVYLVDKDNNSYSVYLNPAFVTDNAIVITLDSEANNVRTEKVVVTSSTGCEKIIDLAKPVPAPSIKMFYSEFVADGDTLRIAGDAFLSVPGDSLKVYFFDKNGNKISAKYKTAHDDCELLVVVPEGVADSKPVVVSNKFGECTSKMLFRDTRNIFLDFDKIIAKHYEKEEGIVYGALDSLSFDWSPKIKTSASKVLYDDLLKAMGGKFPDPCNGYYQAIVTDGKDFNFGEEAMIYYIPASLAVPERNFLGSFIDEDLENLVLKFEIFIPSAVPYATYLYAVFSAYGSEIEDNFYDIYDNLDYGFFSRDLTKVKTFDTETYTCTGEGTGVPAAWLNMMTLSVDDSKSDPTVTLAKPFDTGDRWMTVAIPLKRSSFRYNPSSYKLATNDNLISCGQLEKNRDFGNFFLHADSYGFQDKIPASKECGNKGFCAFDNFRIVPEDGGGVRFTKYYGPTPTSKYPF